MPSLRAPTSASAPWARSPAPGDSPIQATSPRIIVVNSGATHPTRFMARPIRVILTLPTHLVKFRKMASKTDIDPAKAKEEILAYCKRKGALVVGVADVDVVERIAPADFYELERGAYVVPLGEEATVVVLDVTRG